MTYRMRVSRDEVSESGSLSDEDVVELSPARIIEYRRRWARSHNGKVPLQTTRTAFKTFRTNSLNSSWTMYAKPACVCP
jgi:hypothetical protein